MFEFQKSQQERRVAGGGWIPGASAPSSIHLLGSSSRPIPRIRTVLADPDPVARRTAPHVVGGSVRHSAGRRIRWWERDDRSGSPRDRRPGLPGRVAADLDGFEVARRLEGQLSSGLVFVTDRGEHALRAFEVHALDYLLKPVHRERRAGDGPSADDAARTP